MRGGGSGADARQGESRLDGNSFTRPLRLSSRSHDFNHVQGVFRRDLRLFARGQTFGYVRGTLLPRVAFAM